MKKNYSIVCHVQTIIMVLAVSFPVIAHSQDLTAEQKKELCQNNKNRIAELETELRIISADLSQTMDKKEIEDARTKMVNVKSLRAKMFEGSGLSITEEYTLERISVYYNFNCAAFFSPDSCLVELEKLVAKKIDKANSLNRRELLAKKSEIDKQLASHRNRLIELGCNQSAGTLVNNIELSKLKGNWEKDTELGAQHFGFPIVFYWVEINSITGRWGRDFTTDRNGKITGGSYDEATSVLSFTYVQAPDKKTGRVKLLLTETSTEYKLRGTWEHDDGSASGGLMMERLK